MINEDFEWSPDDDDLAKPTVDWATVPTSDTMNWALATGTQVEVESRVIQAYLGSPSRASLSREYSPLFVNIHCVALGGYLEHIGCQIEGTTKVIGYQERQAITSLNLMMVETAPGTREPVPQEGLIFIRRPSGERLVLDLRSDPMGPQPGSRFTVIDARGWGGAFLDGWEQYANEHAYLHGKAFYATGELVAVDPFIRPADVLLEPRARRMVERLILSFPEQAVQFRRRGLSVKRGVILEGPPGTGKTMLCRALCNQLNCTFIWLAPRHLRNDPAAVAHTWRLARLLKPTVILLEDLDLIAESREHSFNGLLLGELMNEMDGVEDNDGILTIATTNHLDVIEKAIRNRPGRFDHAIHLGEMGEAARRSILDRHLQSEELEDGVLERLVCRTPGYTGARMIDLIKSLVEVAAGRSRDGDDRRLRITVDLVDEVLSEAGRPKGRGPVGFMAEQQSELESTSVAF